MLRVFAAAVVIALVTIGCKEEPKPAPPAPQASPAAPATTPASQPATSPPATRERAENDDLKQIQGIWQTRGENGVQLEFRGDNVIERAGASPNWKLTLNSRFKLQNRVLPSQIEWGTGEK